MNKLYNENANISEFVLYEQTKSCKKGRMWTHNRSYTHTLSTVLQVDTLICVSLTFPFPTRLCPFFKRNCPNPALWDSKEIYFITIPKAK